MSKEEKFMDNADLKVDAEALENLDSDEEETQE